ncbi:conserved protein of unknown function [Rhodovastum atsumiense]|uniref:Uncharacterized protein n=1 Tax=Rhodovastum atsumiense TaxID=504468 RepID=A0A5M6IPP8_9PROT|nr:hypothetical protein [Rhodovastum atsumiense]KAA5610252.1 hypothetical protein F1189_19925 [Rhodovastum atsumiense]CAH2602264.1 conserved protein of unknown function [Rhodovastum atsumiense]
MSTTSDGNTYYFFYVCFGDENLKFGIPTALGQKIVESTQKGIKKHKASLAAAIENGEKAIAEAFRKNLHRNEKTSKNIAPLIISCCLLSREAQENPDARGFILEISHSAAASWAAGADAAPPGEAGEPKTHVHYKAVAGRDEIDAFLAEVRAGATGEAAS